MAEDLFTICFRSPENHLKTAYTEPFYNRVR